MTQTAKKNSVPKPIILSRRALLARLQRWLKTADGTHAFAGRTVTPGTVILHCSLRGPEPHYPDGSFLIQAKPTGGWEQVKDEIRRTGVSGSLSMSIWRPEQFIALLRELGVIRGDETVPGGV